MTDRFTEAFKSADHALADEWGDGWQHLGGRIRRALFIQRVAVDAMTNFAMTPDILNDLMRAAWAISTDDYPDT